MAGTIEEADRTLAEFEGRQSNEGRFLRYCRGRSASFRVRAIVTILCTLGVIAMGEWRLGLALAVVMSAADWIECAVLDRYARCGSFGSTFPMVYTVSGALAGLHSLTVITTIVALTGLVDGAAGTFLAIAMFLSGTLDGAQFSHLHRLAGGMRMGVHIAGLFVTVYLGVFVANLSIAEQVYWLIGIGMLVYISLAVLAQSQMLLARRNTKQLDLLRTTRDLAHLNGALAETREATRRLGKIAEAVGDAILVVEPDGIISWANNAFFDLTEYDRQHLIGQPIQFLDLRQEGNETGGNVIEAVSNGTQLRTELSHLHPKGRINWVDLAISPVLNDEGEYESAVLVARDIGAAKERETALAAARKTAEDAMRAKEAFLATMSHEIRTPMNGILGTTDLLLESKLSTQQRSLVQTVSSSGDALLTIVNDILDVSALEAGRLSISKAPFDPNAFIGSLLNIVRPLAEAKGIDLICDLPPDAVPWLNGDAGRLRQILLNLLGNAIKFTESGHVALRVQAQEIEDGLGFQVEVVDTGIGIAPERLAAIFDMFTQADDTIGGRFGGTGLGLAISKRLTEAMGGTLAAQSTVGEGSVFTLQVELPFASGEMHKDAPEQAPPRAPPPAQGKDVPKVLIADDNKTNVFLLEKMLASRELDLVIAMNGQEAVELNAQHTPDLILMDVRMPVMDGLAATGAIRDAERARGAPEVPIVALTANAFPEDRERCADAGMTDFLSKPYRKRDLSAVLDRHLPYQEQIDLNPSQAS